MTKLAIFAGLAADGKTPTFRFEHPFFANQNRGLATRTVYKSVDVKDDKGKVIGKRMRHVKTPAPHRVGVHVSKRTGMGYAVRNFVGPLIADADTRQVRRARERANQYAR